MKKLLKWGGIFFIGLIVLGVIGSIFGGDETTTPTEQAQNSQPQATQAEEQQAEEQVMIVATADLISDFDKNQLAAEEKYKGKSVEFTAKIKNISEDLMGSPFLSLEPEDAEEYYFGTTIQCIFKDKSELTTLENGQIVTVRGVADNQTLGIIGVKDCKVVQ